MADRLPNHPRQVPVPTPFRHPLAPVAPPPPVPALLPLIDVDADMHPRLERLLRPVALRAKNGDWTARDALFQAFEAKLWRMCGKIILPPSVPGGTGVWDRNDLWQEGWIVFAAIVDRWPPAVPFGRYLLAHFPWRLRDAVRSNLRRPSVPPRWASRVDDFDADSMSCPRAAAAEAWTDIDASLAQHDPLDRDIITLRMQPGCTKNEVSRQLQVSERTIHRRLVMIRRCFEDLR